MNTSIKISVLIISLGCILSCKTQHFETPEYGSNETEKVIHIKKVTNFRTVGNIRNTEGRTLKEGKLYRSAHLHKLKKRSFDHLGKLGIKEIIDLRNSKEISQKPDQLPANIFTKNIQLLKMKEISWPRLKNSSLKVK